MDKNERYLSLISSEIQYYQTHHNHKETMAWVITVFYTSIVIVFVSSANIIATDFTSKILIFLVVIWSSCIAAFFVEMQFRFRWEADDYIVGLKKIRAELDENNEFPANYDKKEMLALGDKNLPIFIEKSINLTRTTTNLFFSKGNYGKRVSELSSYAILLTGMGIAVVAIIISDFSNSIP